MSCVMEVPYCIVKGTDFQTTVSLTTAWEEVIENPQDYRGEMVFRASQSDTAAVYLTLISMVEVDDADAPAQMIFHASPTQTAQLPDWDHVAFVDLVKTDGSSRSRLYNSEVDVHE